MSGLVYAALEYRIRQTLAEHNESVPDQKGKPTVQASAKWVFELFMDVHLLTITSEKTIRALVLNLREELKRLLALIGAIFVKHFRRGAESQLRTTSLSEGTEVRSNIREALAGFLAEQRERLAAGMHRP